jgi:7,8-dihydro-6-hydroxymethylpterin-pyrophosphokinase
MAIRAYVGLGSNLAHPRRQLAKALAQLQATTACAYSPFRRIT